MITHTITTDYPAVPLNRRSHLQVLLSLRGDGPCRVYHPLSISISLDRSGSMSGSKIVHALKATEMIARLMTEQDTFSLITFDNRIDTVIEPTKGLNKEHLPAMLATIQARGNTCLSGGYLQAVSAVRESRASGDIARILLLSDGQANEGITDARGLSQIVRDALESEITTTTFGLGDDFDEELLSTMAKEGGGNAYFIDKPQESLEIFKEELDALRQLAATRCAVSFSPKVSSLQVNQLNSYREGDERGWLIGDVSHAGDRTIMFGLEIPAMSDLSDSLELGSFTVSWMTHGEQNELQSQVIPLTVSVVSTDDFEKITPNHEVVLEGALQLVAQVKKDVRVLCLEGRGNRAIRMLDDTIDRLLELSVSSDDLRDELRELRTIKRRILDEGTEYLISKESKYLHYLSMNLGSGNKELYQKAKARYKRYTSGQ